MGKLAELCSQYLTREEKFHITGRLQTSHGVSRRFKETEDRNVANDVVLSIVPKGREIEESGQGDIPQKDDKPAKMPKKGQKIIT